MAERIYRTLPNGRTVDFKAGTSVEEQNRLIAEKIGPDQVAAEYSTDTAGELGKAIKSGVFRGFTGVAGLPADAMAGLEAAGARARTETPDVFEAGGISGMIGGTGQSPSIPEALGIPGRPATEVMGTENIRKALASMIGGVPERPVTRTGQVAETGMEFATGAVVPGLGFTKVRSIPKLATIGTSAGGTSEAIGGSDVFKGTPLEPYARIAGAVIGSADPRVLARRGTTRAGANVLERAGAGITPEQADLARRRIAAGQEIGVPVAPVEALDQPTLSTLASDVTATTRGASVADTNLGRRVPKVERAIENLESQAITPTNRNIDLTSREVGERIADASENLAEQAIRPRTSQGDKLFKAAREKELDATDVTPIIEKIDDALYRAPAGNSSLRTELETLRSRLVRDAESGMVETRIEPLETTRQEFRERAKARFATMGKRSARQDSVARVVGPILDDLTTQMRKIDTFAEGMDTYQKLSPDIDKILNADVVLLGRNAKPKQLKDLARKAVNMVTDVDTNPREITRNMNMWFKVDSALPQNLTKLYLDRQLRAAMKRGIEGTPASAGAKFYNLVAGNKKQRANLNAMFGALEKQRKLKKGTLTNALETTLTALERAGAIRAPGSATAGRSQTFSELRSGPGLQALKDFVGDLRFNRNVGEISDLLTNPNRLEDLLKVVSRGPRRVTENDVVRALGIQQSLSED